MPVAHLVPAPDAVARTLAAMTTEPWPTTEAESLAWLRRHGIDPATAVERDRRESSRAWDGARMADWGGTRAGWGTYRDEFTGIHWFLWSGASSDDVMAGAQALVDRLHQAHGPATEASESPQYGRTALWQLPGHVIDLYAYHGLPREDGFPAGDASVQLHLSHRERSEAQELEARAMDSGPPPGLSDHLGDQ